MKSFTLIEILVASGIFTGVIVAGIAFYPSQARSKGHIRGFTLIEILVAAGIFTGVIVAGMAFYATTLKNVEHNRLVRELSQVGRQSVETLEREVRASFGSVDGGGRRICQSFIIRQHLDPIPADCSVSSLPAGNSLTLYRQEGVSQTVTQRTFRPVQVASDPDRFTIEVTTQTSRDFGRTFSNPESVKLLPFEIALFGSDAMEFAGYFPTGGSVNQPYVTITLVVKNFDFASRPTTRRAEEAFATMVTIRDPHVKY